MAWPLAGMWSALAQDSDRHSSFPSVFPEPWESWESRRAPRCPQQLTSSIAPPTRRPHLESSIWAVRRCTARPMKPRQPLSLRPQTQQVDRAMAGALPFRPAQKMRDDKTARLVQRTAHPSPPVGCRSRRIGSSTKARQALLLLLESSLSRRRWHIPPLAPSRSRLAEGRVWETVGVPVTFGSQKLLRAVSSHCAVLGWLCRFPMLERCWARQGGRKTPLTANPRLGADHSAARQGTHPLTTSLTASSLEPRRPAGY